MSLPHRATRLVRVSRANSSDLRLWREGASLVAQSGSAIDDLRLLAATARWQFATALRREGMRALRSAPPMYRVAVARFYYAMYHAIRAVVYVEYDGDDYQDHRTLPTKAVAVLPAASQWQNKLKNARTFRNQADYDPYPRSDRAWRQIALDLRQDAAELLAMSRTYLQAKGCHL